MKKVIGIFFIVIGALLAFIMNRAGRKNLMDVYLWHMSADHCCSHFIDNRDVII